MTRVDATMGREAGIDAIRFVRDLLTGLDAEGVRWRLLRNHEFLVDGSAYRNADLDILVAWAHLAVADRLLRGHGFVRTASGTVRRHVGYAACPPGSSDIVAVDLHVGDPSWNDVPYFPGSLLLEDTAPERTWWVDRPSHVAALLTLHAILDKKGFKPRYRRILERLVAGGLDAREVGHLVSRAVGPATAGRLVGALTRGDFQGLLAERRRTVLSLLIRNPERWPDVARCLVRSRWRRLRRLLRPPALLVAVVGPDGSGKSTAVSGVCRRLVAAGIPVRRFYMGRWHHHVLPLAGLARRHGAARARTREPIPAAHTGGGGDPVRIAGRPWFRLARDAAYVLDMWMRYLVRLWPARRRPGVVITDRYAYDLLLDPNATVLAHAVMTRLFPRPDLCVYLTADVGTLLARKSEQSPDELARQLRLYDAYGRKLRWVRISAADEWTSEEAVFGRVLARYLKSS